MQTPDIILTPLTKFRFEVAVRERRIRRADYHRTRLTLTLNDSTTLDLATEAEAIIALRCLTSAAHAGKTPAEAREAERKAATHRGVKV
jgi:hypothetical protein